MNLPKFHFSEFDEVAGEIKDINSSLEKSFSKFEEVAKQRIVSARKEIELVALEIENLLKANNTDEIKFHAIEYIYVLQLTVKGDSRIYKTTRINNEVLMLWEPYLDVPLKDVCKNVSVKSSSDAHEVLNAVTQLEKHADDGKVILAAFMDAVKRREDKTLREITSFIAMTDKSDKPE